MAVSRYVLCVLALFSACLIPSCQFRTLRAHQTERKLVRVLTDVFEQEDAVARATDVKMLEGHVRNLEMMLRSLNLERAVALVMPLLGKLRGQARTDADFIQSVDRVVQEAGCSHALVVALDHAWKFEQKRPRQVFGFMDTDAKTLDPKYRYSQQILDNRAMASHGDAGVTSR